MRNACTSAASTSVASAIANCAPTQIRGPAPKGTGGRAARSGLTGIIYSKHGRVAIIGGEALREGSMVGDKRLADIRKKSVVLMNASGGREEVFLEDFSMGR